MDEEKETILLITDSAYYPIYFRHHLKQFQTNVIPSSFSPAELDTTKARFVVIDDQQFKDSIFDVCYKLRGKAPLLVITGKLKVSYIDRLTEVGVTGFIQEPLEEALILQEFENAKKIHLLEEKLDIIGETISEHSTSIDLRQKLFLNKNLIDPILKTLKTRKPLSLLAIATEYSEAHEFTDRHITDTIKRVVKEKNPIFSLGQGKYLIILDEANLSDATFIAETLRDVITHTMHIGIVIGISSQKKPPYDNIHDMIGDAKKALLDAQKKGITIEIYH